MRALARKKVVGISLQARCIVNVCRAQPGSLVADAAIRLMFADIFIYSPSSWSGTLRRSSTLTVEP